MKRLIVCLLLVVSELALAHKPSDSYLQLESRDDSTVITGQWDIALRDLNLILPLDTNRDGLIMWGELLGQQPAIASQILSTLTVNAMTDRQTADCPLSLTGLQVSDHVDGRYAALHLRGNCPIAPQFLEVDYQFLFAQDPEHHGLLKLRHNDDVLTATFSDGQRQQQLSQDSVWQSFQGFIGQGIHHILIGYDHILFLLTLLFPAVLVWRTGGWQPAPSMTMALGQTLSIVTAFTLTHSLTLALATLGIISLPSWLVESAIAATVAIGAVANLLPRFFPRRWVMAFVFGLIHGLGFASVLADLGLTSSGIFLPLLGFNIGVELGQVAIVMVFVPIAYLMRQTHFYQRIFVPAGSLSIMVLAGVWLVERLA
ncbi:HupE/UreJ family protein [Alcanivorax sp. S6407]|uniref:HupE/UreJ family protein n=1 Tax=Alcanivorax sp. S6407 TaxID=2926424 RepID=UPI001FF3A1FB|nr:HupE/UreJ family protein [Alcanivorax sp. S6407]MCK0154753.1 HupE/UreJ family protein [Alcanivorax sp. S6407]